MKTQTGHLQGFLLYPMIHIFSCGLYAVCVTIHKFTEVDMRTIWFLMAFMFLLLPVSSSHGFSEKGQDCSKCHNLNKEEALTLLKDLDPNIQILEIKTGPIKGVWEVDIVTGGKKGLTYVDFSKKHLISGSVFVIKEKKNLTQERIIELNKVEVSQIPLKDALLMGKEDAKYKVVVFDDPD
jgi:thiol:disulfide interchange protein DsbC